MPLFFTGAALAVSSVRISVPYAAGALGGTLSERGGVVNIALEGLMLGGAFAYAATSWWVERRFGPGCTVAAPLAGLAAAVGAGLCLALVHATATVVFKADNIISGLAINILSLGLTNFLLKRIFDSSSNSERCPSFQGFAPIPDSSPFAVLNQLCHPLILLTLLVFVAAHILLHRTRFGLRLQAVGENPEAADSLGIGVASYRFRGVLLSGAVASLGGVWLASDQGLFSSSMTNGRGYIALAAMIVGNWKPGGAAAACLVFGFAEACQNHLQIFKQHAQNLGPDALGWIEKTVSAIPVQAIQAFPYLLTILIIAGFVGRTTPPAADGVPFDKENE